LTSAKAEENARWRERQAGRFKGITRGFMGSMVQSQRRSERMEHADLINRIVEQQQRLDEQSRDIDWRIRDLQAGLREQAPAKAPRAKGASGPATSPAERLQALEDLRRGSPTRNTPHRARESSMISKSVSVGL
jgi:hypothetical protein